MSSTGPSLPNESTPTQVVGSIESEEARKREAAAAAQRYAEVSLKSVPIPEGVDPNQRATVGEAVKSIKAEDFTRVHQAPCTREGLLTGIGSGAAIGALRYITGVPVPKSANWAVGSGVAISIIAYEYCQHQRRMERANMKRIVEVVSKKQVEQKKLEDEKKRQQQLEQEAGTPKAPAKSWYNLW